MNNNNNDNNDNNDNNAQTYVCAECGSENVQQKMWINLNTRQTECALMDTEDFWCNDCEEHIDIFIK